MKRICIPFLCAVAVCAVAPSDTRAANTEGGGYEVIANAFGFGVDIPECPDASKNIREVAIDDARIDIREEGTDPATGERLYGPGQAHWGSAKFTSKQSPPGEPSATQAWWAECAKGKNIRKNITVTLFKSDKSPGRSYILMDCFPTSWTSEVDEQNRENVEILEVQPTSIVHLGGSSGDGSVAKAEATSSDKFAQVRGFKIDIANAGGKEVDTAWESVSGGEMIIELTETTIGADKFKTTSPGHKSVGEITLRGAMTDGRKALCEWINDTVNGKPWKRMLTITELLSVDGGVKDGKAYVYMDCFPIRYVFPRMSVTNTTGNVMEEVYVKAVRSESLPPKTIGKIEIEGAPLASAGAVAVALDDRALDAALLPKTDDMRNPSIRILFKRGSAEDLRKWFGEMKEGPIERKSITIRTREGNKLKNGSPNFVLLRCYPVSWDDGNFYSSDPANEMEEVRLKPTRCELR